jgi:predicted dithiol-disulfide oxidoreductase (DUF899 family)
MTEHRIGTRREWEAERRALLEREKELTRLSDELAQARQALPWVPVEEEYVFESEDGPKTLTDLFDGRSQLIVQHFMFGPHMEAGCPSCTAIAESIELPRVHLEQHDVTFVAVSLAPLDRLLAYRERMGWTFPWVSSNGSDFNFDFQASSTPERPLREYNWREVPAEMSSSGPAELPGVSSFILRDGQVFHTYSAHARGLDALWSVYAWLDRAPLGRNEGPDAAMGWMRRRDEYEAVIA